MRKQIKQKIYKDIYKDIERYCDETYLRGDFPCMDCQSKDNIQWTTHNVFWNRVMKGVKGSGILCVYCFVRRAEKKFKVSWFLLPQFEWKKKHNLSNLKGEGNMKCACLKNEESEDKGVCLDCLKKITYLRTHHPYKIVDLLIKEREEYETN